MKTDSVPRSGTSPHPEGGAPAGQADVDAPVQATAQENTEGAVPVVRPRRQPLSPRARFWLILAVAAALAVFLISVRTVIQPFVWAVVTAYVLNPIVTSLHCRLHLRRGASVSIVMAVFLGLLAWGISAAIPTLRSDILALTNSLSDFNIFLTSYVPNAGTISIAGFQIQVPQLVHNVQTALQDVPHTVIHGGMAVITNTIDLLLHVLTYLLSTFYLLLDAPRLRAWCAERIPPAYRDETIILGRRVNTVLSEYLRAEIILILIMSTASLIALSVLGVRFALLLAPLVGILEIFPFVGPFFAITMVSLVALISPPNFGLSHIGYAIVVALVFFVLRQIEDYLVIPNVVGHAVRLHPVLILFMLLSGAALGGILGMFLAVPITGVIKVLGGYMYDRIVE